jgi:hypothetical protein
MIEKWLRTLAYFAVICLCCVRLHSYWDGYRAKPKVSPQSLAASLVGSRISLRGSAEDKEPKETIVIAITTSCVFCRARAPFYKKLLRGARSLPGSVRTIAVMPESQEVAVRLPPGYPYAYI